MLKKTFKQCYVSPSTCIKELLTMISQSGLRILLVTNESEQLLGTITDGDIRRSLIKNGSLQGAASDIMNPSPMSIDENTGDNHSLALMREHGILHLPVINKDGAIIGLKCIDDILEEPTKKNSVIFMAGGQGQRLLPLTLEKPKPLVKVSGKPMLERLLEKFIDDGFSDFYITVNYKADMILNYFGNGERWGVNIKYIHEKKIMGTAGSLGLLDDKQENPFFVINSDIVTSSNFASIMDYHLRHKERPDLTICVRQQENTIPYGVVNIDKEDLGLIDIQEKPSNAYFINAGIYVLEPKVLKLISSTEYCDMTTLINRIMANSGRISTYPICEYWLDVGRHEQLEKANNEYHEVIL